uniref:O-acyl-ADP-ribose deacylase 1 n=1 Tax=Rousettus aegyptiacus TaxID=9407 RepID=A0A7J8KDL3_ROUAE|nr:O-acyl-ADP-ribose deacylase 1 [Rousettus aegyptiacus]
MAGSPNEDPEGSRITYVKGDLFTCPKTDSLAHCISEDCRMGAGIAVLFKKKFGGVQELLNQHYKEKGFTQANLQKFTEEFRGHEVPLFEEWSHQPLHAQDWVWS